MIAGNFPYALRHKESEYLVASYLKRQALPAFDQTMIMSAVCLSPGFEGTLVTVESNAEGSTDSRRTAPMKLQAEILRHQESKGLVLRHLEDIALPEKTEFASFAAAAVPGQDLGALIEAMDRAELWSRMYSETARGEQELIPAFLAWLETTEASLPESARGESLFSRAENLWLVAKVYSKMLPRMQERNEPTAAEYFNSLKSALVELAGMEKWMLHLILGGLAFFATAAFLVLAGIDKGRSCLAAFAVVFLIAVAVELIDWRDGVLNGKDVTLSGSISDIVVTCVVAMLGMAWAARSRVGEADG